MSGHSSDLIVVVLCPHGSRTSLQFMYLPLPIQLDSSRFMKESHLFSHSVYPSRHLCRNTRIDTLIKRATWRMDCEFLFIFLEKFNIVLVETGDLVDILDCLIGPVTRDLTSSGWEHAAKLLVITLC